eukprot:5367522-Alexandrium_andersonii.AAC.1
MAPALPRARRGCRVHRVTGVGGRGAALRANDSRPLPRRARAAAQAPPPAALEDRRAGLGRGPPGYKTQGTAAMEVGPSCTL